MCCVGLPQSVKSFLNLSTVDLFRPPLRRPVTLPLKPVKEDKTELSLIYRRDNKISGISVFATSKFSITVIVLTLTLMSFL